ncbi:MAG: hypothetical protein JW955_14165 [Sedimentisphaerales bacterium]|nr:hypothetical protein [Sedimentisphaerales bacterium]
MVLARRPSEFRDMPGIHWFHHLTLAPVVASLLLSVAAGKYSGGSGISTDPYLIRTAEELNTLGNSPGDWDKCFRLMEDIDLEGYNETNFHLIGSWVSYGDTANQPYRAIFDGNGRTISNLRYRDMKGNGIGLFRYVHGGDVRNLTLKNVKIVSDGVDVGALVGRMGSGGIVNCHVVGVDVMGNTRVGGLVGNTDGGIYQCSSRGRVAGVWYVGGLVGGVGDAIVKTSYSKASVSGNESVGGLIGATLNQEAIVDSCYANGSVTGTLYVGGLAGQVVTGRVYKCYSTGAVKGSQSAGGLTGNLKILGDVMASFWDAETSGQTGGAGTGKTTAEMWSADTYSTWDFIYTWTICDGRNYPVFLWQIPTADLRCPDGVNATDFAWFAIQWRRDDCGGANWDCEWADFDGSGDVRFPDLAILAEEWLTGVY